MRSVTLFTFLVYTIDRWGTKLGIISVLRPRILNSKQAEGFVWMGSRMRSVWVRRRDEDTPARKTDGRERRWPTPATGIGMASATGKKTNDRLHNRRRELNRHTGGGQRTYYYLFVRRKETVSQVRVHGLDSTASLVFY
jgi:hypothetical protein